MNYIPSDIIEHLKGLNTEDVAKKLGMNVVKHRTLCFVHKDTHPSLSFLPNGHGWNCFSCEAGGYDAISFVKKYLKCDFLTACRWLCKAYSIYLDDENFDKTKLNILQKRKSYKIEEKKKTLPPRSYYDIIAWIVEQAKISQEAADFLFKERLLDSEVVKELHIGSIISPERLIQKLTEQFSDIELIDTGIIKMNAGKRFLRVFTPCVLFPYYDVDGQLVGLQSRYIGKNGKAPRFQFIGCNNIPIFNLPILKQINRGEDLYIAEGVTDCMSLLSDGKKAVAIPSAGNLPDESLRLLTDFRLHMYPDNDKGAGICAYRNLRSKLINMGNFLYRETLPLEFKDYSEYYQYEKRK